MARHRILFFLAALWEVARFIATFNIATLILAVNTSMVKATAVVWLGSPQLILAAGFLVIGAVPERKAPLLNALRLGKLLEVASLALVLATLRQSAMVGTGFQAFFVTIAPYVVGVVDLILLILLLSYRSDSLDRLPRHGTLQRGDPGQDALARSEPERVRSDQMSSDSEENR
ncbi:MAG: hypothetical protein ACLFO1_08640 [Spirochaetaceae bacterium]